MINFVRYQDVNGLTIWLKDKHFQATHSMSPKIAFHHFGFAPWDRLSPAADMADVLYFPKVSTCGVKTGGVEKSTNHIHSGLDPDCK